MANKIVLVSDDSDFFDYIRSKLELRKSDELFLFNFDSVPEKLHLLKTSVIIVNSENAEEKTLDLLNLFQGTPIIVSSYNEDEVFRRKCFRAGMFDFMPLLTPDVEFRARLIPALSVASLLEKNLQYRKFLVKNEIISQDSEVFLDYGCILDKELEEINAGLKKAVLVAISPSDKTKFLLKPALIESVVLNNIRKNDILMNYAPNKYFLLLFDTDVKSTQKLMEKINYQLPEKIYSGICSITNQKRQQLINEALNKLHQDINIGRNEVCIREKVDKLPLTNNVSNMNFKMFKQEFGRKIEQVITPVFYQIQQKYLKQLIGVTLEQYSDNACGSFFIKGKNSSSSFRITSPGFSKINIDITFQRDATTVDAKRITLEPEELEAGLLEDLLEQFILEYKRGDENES